MFEDFGGNKLIQDSGYLPSPFTVFQVVQAVSSMVCLPSIYINTSISDSPLKLASIWHVGWCLNHNECARVQALLVSVDPVYILLQLSQAWKRKAWSRIWSIPKVTAVVKHLGMSILCLRQQQENIEQFLQQKVKGHWHEMLWGMMMICTPD